MFDEQSVWLANAHGHLLGDTNLTYKELCEGDGATSAVTLTRIFVVALLQRINCSEDVTHDEVQEMIDNVYEDNCKVIIKLPERFACPNHGFAKQP
ncbi:hypothetical protein HGB13_04555 [bacterium]|nr:hypothetical protein [bacterium]